MVKMSGNECEDSEIQEDELVERIKAGKRGSWLEALDAACFMPDWLLPILWFSVDRKDDCIG